MQDFIDNFARILATPMPRRKAFKLFGGALAAAVVGIAGVQPAEAAACTQKELNTGLVTCGSGKNATCCKPGCCNGVNCCSKGYLQGGQCLTKKPVSGSYTSC
jgi:hypothetical protein